VTEPAPQRPDWHGVPVRLSLCWTLKKDRRALSCTLYSHPSGWELRMTYMNTCVRSQVCRSEDDVFAAQDAWKRAMRTKGWM
jgi:hypothetical protein